jgi:hypothetical protein
MRNVDMQVSDKNVLTITIDLNQPGVVSSSGKSLVIGTTEGNISVPGKEEVKVGLNVYTKKSA